MIDYQVVLRAVVYTRPRTRSLHLCVCVHPHVHVREADCNGIEASQSDPFPVCLLACMYLRRA